MTQSIQRPRLGRPLVEGGLTKKRESATLASQTLQLQTEARMSEESLETVTFQHRGVRIPVRRQTRRRERLGKCAAAVAATSLMFGSTGCPREDPATGSGGAATDGLCATEGVIATTGGDHGEAWHNPFAPDSSGDDESSGSKLDIGFPPPWIYDFPMPDVPPPQVNPDPTWWEFDPSTRFHYRAATAHEMAENGWKPTTLLVIPSDATKTALAAGSRSVVLPLPLADELGPQANLAFLELDLELRAAQGPIAFPTLNIDRSGRRTRTVRRPMLHFYLTRGLDWDQSEPVAVKVLASSDGATELSGAMADRSLVFRGPYPTNGEVHRIDILPPRGTSVWLLHTKFESPIPGTSQVSAVPVELMRQDQNYVDSSASVEVKDFSNGPVMALASTGYQCADGLDNDVDGAADSCDFDCAPHPEFGGLLHPHTALHEYSKDIGMLGDAVFCGQNPSTALTMLISWGMGGAQLLSWIEAPLEYRQSVRTPPFRLAYHACITLESLSVAEACHGDPTECPDGYPFEGTAGNWVSTSQAAWDAIDAVVTGQPAAEVHPLNFVVVATTDADPEHLGDGGIGTFPFFDELQFNGTAVVWTAADDVLPVERIVAHEVGHTVGLAHDGAYEYGVAGIMNPSDPPTAPLLDWDAPSKYDPEGDGTFLTQGDVWGRLLLDPWFPRPRGFKLDKCEADSDCTGGHPGLVCVESTGWCH